MEEFIGEEGSNAKPGPESPPVPTNRPSDSLPDEVIEPKREEHMLFERFMRWWNCRHSGHKQPIEPERHFTFFKIWDAFAQTECPLCYLTRKARNLFLSSLWYESVNDVGLRNRLHRSLGFSPEAAATSQAMGDSLGMSIVYRALSEDVADRLHTHRSVHPAEPCPVAEHVAIMNRNSVTALAAHYVAEDVQALHDKSFAFCLQHIQEMLDALPTPGLQRTLRQIEEKKFRKLREELDTFIAKSDYQNHEPPGPERDAWLRAVRKFHRQEPHAH